MNSLKVMVCRDEKQPERKCKPALQIEALINAGEIDAEDFHAVGILAALGRATNLGPWIFVTGMSPAGLRHWLECDGWAVECGYTEALITTTDFFYKSTSVNQLRRYTPPEVADRILTKEGRMALGIRAH